MKATENKWLKVNEGVVLTSTIEPVIIALDKEFEKAERYLFPKVKSQNLGTKLP